MTLFERAAWFERSLGKAAALARSRDVPTPSFVCPVEKDVATRRYIRARMATPKPDASLKLTMRRKGAGPSSLLERRHQDPSSCRL